MILYLAGFAVLNKFWGLRHSNVRLYCYCIYVTLYVKYLL